MFKITKATVGQRETGVGMKIDQRETQGEHNDMRIDNTQQMDSRNFVMLLQY